MERDLPFSTMPWNLVGIVHVRKQGRSLGYEPVCSFYDSLQPERCMLPERDHADGAYAALLHRH